MACNLHPTYIHIGRRRACRFTVIAVAITFLAITFTLILVNVLYVENLCDELSEFSIAENNDTVIAKEISDCQSSIIAIVDKSDIAMRANVCTHNCNNLKVHHQPINKFNELTNEQNLVHNIFNGSESSIYFADGVECLISINASVLAEPQNKATLHFCICSNGINNECCLLLLKEDSMGNHRINRFYKNSTSGY